MRRTGILLAALTGLAWAAGAGAQATGVLDRVEELVSEGRTEEAREALLGWWADGYTDASRPDAQRGLWLRARLTVDPAQASMDYRRLVIEYPGGPYSGSALFRLAQAAFALGDSASAREGVARLLLDYPSSNAAREAEAWLASAGPLPPAPVDTDPPAGTTDSASVAIQLGAFSLREGAERVKSEVETAGFTARIIRVPGSSLFRVRVGAFDSAEEADVILGRLRERGFTAALVRDAHLEERIGR